MGKVRGVCKMRCGLDMNKELSSKKINEAFNRAIKRELLEKKKLNIPIAIFKNGKIVKIPPAEI